MRRIEKGVQLLLTRGPRALFWAIVYSYYYHREQSHSEALCRRKGTRATATVFSRDMALHASLLGINQELLRYGIHEPQATYFYQRFLEPADRIIEVGANIGYFLWAAAEAIGETGRYIAFEPLPSNYSVLLENIDSHPHLRGRVETFMCAAGRTPGSCEFYESEVPNWGSMVRDGRLRQARVVKVKVESIDEVVGKRAGFSPTVIRMDVEGAEFMVLDGAWDVIRKKNPMLFIEFHPSITGGDKMLAVMEKFMELGYRRCALIERRWDVPWIGKWARSRHCFAGDIRSICKRLGSSIKEYPVVSVILERCR